MVAVPDVVGDTQAVAEQAITDAGLTPAVATATTSTTDASLDGTVASQDPASGTQVDPNSTVTITLYEHMAAQVAVPDVVGETEAAARTAIEGAGLVFAVSATTRSTTNQSIDGTVAVQAPAAGTMVDSGSTVTVTLFEYTAPTPTQVEVPDTTGNTRAAAETAITDAGLMVGTVTFENETSGTDNRVIRTTLLRARW